MSLFGTTYSLACIFLTAIFAQAASFYASPTGSASGNGGIASPWDLKTALNQPTIVRPGDTLYLRAGTYQTVDGGYFKTSITGTASQLITIRPYGNERPVINGGVEVTSGYLMFRDLEVTSTSTNRISNQNNSWPTDIAQLVGFNVYGPGVRIVNNVIHDVQAGMNSWAQGTDDEFYGNIVYYNGWFSTVNGAHGHGIYMQNQTGRKAITDNIIFNQFDHGIHLYGSAAAALNNFDIEGNIAFNNGSLGLYYSRNILLGGGNPANNPVIRNNYMYYPPSSTLGGDDNIGYNPGGTGCTNLILENNYWVSDGWAITLFNCTITSLTGNTFYGQWRGVSPGTYPNNQFYPLVSRPTGARVFVRPNRYEAGRANIVVFNWDRASTVNADVSLVGLVPGDLYEVRDVQNYFGAPVASGTYLGGTVAVPTTSSAIAAPVGNAPYPPVHTDREFQSYVIRKVGTGSVPPPDTVPPQVTLTSPVNGQVLSGTISLTASASDDVRLTSVRFQIDGTNVSGDVANAPYTIPLDTKTLANGTHTITATARDGAENVAMSAAVTVSVSNVAATAATLSNALPTGLLASGTVQTSISLKTDKSATCRYSKSAGVAYSSMSSAFSTTGGTSHSAVLLGLVSGANYVYYVRCQTSAGIVNTTDYTITFGIGAVVTVPPTAPGPQSVYTYVEAENGVLANPMFSAQWSTASGGWYVRSSVMEKGTVTLTFSAPTAGTYIFWGRTYSQDPNKDSFYVSVDGGAEDIWDTATGTWGGLWQWTRVTGRAANGGTPSMKNANPRVFNLPAGQHTIRFRGLDTYTYLDRILLTNDQTFVPK